jgi:hypothetical protein
MPKGIPRAGFRRTKRYKTKSLQELEKDIADKAPYIVEELEKLTKPFPCPHCGNEIRIIDKDVGMYLVDRALGKPNQKQEVDITENIQLNADQVAGVISRNVPRFLSYLAANHPSELIAFVQQMKLLRSGSE